MIDSILKQHSVFKANGGRVERILVSSKPGEQKPSERYVRATARMMDSGVIVRYRHVEPYEGGVASGWDFLLVGTGENGKDEAVIWSAAKPSGLPTETIYSCTPLHNDHDLDEAWRSYHNDSIQL